MPDNDHDVLDAGIAHRAQHVADQRFACHLVQHLRGVGLHAGSEARGQDDRYRVVHARESSDP